MGELRSRLFGLSVPGIIASDVRAFDLGFAVQHAREGFRGFGLRGYRLSHGHCKYTESPNLRLGVDFLLARGTRRGINRVYWEAHGFRVQG